jgi:hypothetical protein
MSDFIRGVAFIFEGQTERVFYNSMLQYFVAKNEGFQIIKEMDQPTNDYRYIISNDNQSVIVRMYTVGTIISHTSAAARWFKANCKQVHKGISWTVFLCYDTDSHNSDASQFQEGDWKDLRKTILKNKRTEIIDLAAQADIEDIMLLDIDGVCDFLGIPTCQTPPARKGKAKMKKLFRDNKSFYHEGERAGYLIDHLDKGVIISKTSIPLYSIEEACFK